MSGRKVPFSDAELARFSQYVSHREAHKPVECTGGQLCWVNLGPPGWRWGKNGHGQCAECKGSPKVGR